MDNYSRSKPNVYYINESFFIYNQDDAIKLRRRRIVGQLTGCTPTSPHQIAYSGMPYLLSHYTVSVVLSLGLANFLKLLDKETINQIDNEDKFSKILDESIVTSEKEFFEKRLYELKKRNIEPSERRIGTFDKTKFKLTISNEPKRELSSYDIVRMSSEEVKNKLKVDECKSFAFHDLYEKEFYISSGLKFGSDFLVYLGDPVRYHAQFAARAIPSKDGSVDLSMIHYNEYNCLNRLCHTANKTLLLAAVYSDINGSKRVKYWTLRSRQCLGPESDKSSFELIDPIEYARNSPIVNDDSESSAKSSVAEPMNKMRRVHR